MDRNATFSLLITGAAAFLVSCGPPVPATSTYADVMGGGACYMNESYGEPLVVDWRPELRTDLEVAMKEGVPVVAYDCKSLRLLPDCTVEGSYGFMGTSTKEQMVRLSSALEVGANLPFSGLKLGAELDQEATLDVALILIGKKVSTRRDASRKELRGRCDGATHFVRGVTIGAFAMETGTKGKARAAAELFSGLGASVESRSGKRVRNTDGSIDACRTANPDDPRPPNQCGAAIRLQLLPIDGPPLPPDEGAALSGCPKGFVEASGRCARPDESEAHRCAISDKEDCQKQCDRDEAASCHNLGEIYWTGKGVEKDEKQAVTFFEKACKLGHHMACNNLGLFRWKEGDHGRALALYKQACDAGETMACTNLGTMYWGGKGVDKSQKRAIELFRLACDGGDPLACDKLALTYEDGLGVGKDQEKALALYKRACDGRFPQGCTDLGIVYKEGKLAPKDPKKAFELLNQACDRGDMKGCSNLGGLYEAGEGVAKDELKGFSLHLKACEGDYKNACLFVGIAYEKGAGVSRDGRRAVDYYFKGCEAGNNQACSILAGKLVNGEGVPRDVKKAGEAARIACKRGHEKSCQGLADVADLHYGGDHTPRDYSAAATLYQEACNHGVARGCGKLAYIVEFGKGGTKTDMAQAIKGYTTACDRGHFNSCSNLGVVKWNGKGTPRDTAAAIQLWERACNKGDIWGCLNLSILAEYGVERKASKPDAESLFKRGCGGAAMAACEKAMRGDCTGGEERSCTVMGGLLARGQGYKANRTEGVKLVTQGCAAGDGLACDLLQKLGAPQPKKKKPDEGHDDEKGVFKF